MVAQLVAKFEATRPNQPLSADAPTIFAMWSFAVEHWTQALGQASSPSLLPTSRQAQRRFAS